MPDEPLPMYDLRKPGEKFQAALVSGEPNCTFSLFVNAGLVNVVAHYQAVTVRPAEARKLAAALVQAADAAERLAREEPTPAASAAGGGGEACGPETAADRPAQSQRGPW